MCIDKPEGRLNNYLFSSFWTGSYTIDFIWPLFVLAQYTNL